MVDGERFTVGRDPRPPAAAETRDRGREARGGAPFGRSHFFSVSRNLSPVTCAVGVASSRGRLRRQRRETGVGRRAGGLRVAGYGVRSPVSRHPSPVHSRGERRGSGDGGRCALRARPFLSRLPQPVSRNLSCGSGILPRFLSLPDRGWKPLPQSRVAGGGGREARGGARSARGRLVFPVSRHPSPVTRLLSPVSCHPSPVICRVSAPSPGGARGCRRRWRGRAARTCSPRRSPAAGRRR